MKRAFGSLAGGFGTALAAMALVAAMAGSAAAQCGGTQLCAPGLGDCAVTTACTITLPPGGLAIDLGTRRLVITRTLTVQGSAGAALFLKVGDLLIDSGTILASGANGIAGSVSISSATNITVRNSGVIDVSAGQGAGVVELEARGGDLSFSGRIKANGDLMRTGYGGEVDLFATGSMTVDGAAIDVSGGDLGGAGFLTLEAQTGSVNVTAPLKAAGGDGGDIDLSAGTTLQTTASAVLNVNANGDAGSGGAIDIRAGGNIVIGGETIGTGSLPDFQMDGRFGGDGADFDVFSANGNVTVNGRIDISAAAGGSGGALDIDAARDLSFSKPLIAQSGGADGFGGEVFLTSGGTTSLPSNIDVSGSTGSGGSIEAYAIGNLTVSGSLLADGDRLGGIILLTGCAVNVPSTGLLSARGPGGVPLASNTVRASSTMTIAGLLRATTRNLLEYRAAPAPTVTGSVTPVATQVLNPLLPCCVSCPVTTTTTSTTSTTSITSTTVRTTTTTSSTIAGSTTTTTTTSSTTTTTAPSICGNGVVTGAEQCDDGNTVAGDCCSPACTFEAVNASCANDGNACTRDVCNGAGACTHPAGNAGAMCRPASGVCDQAETCTGTTATCPVDAKRTDACRPAAGACDVAESCNGADSTCPADAFAPATTTCRQAAGVCDRAETCTGSGPACPADQLAPSGTSCRAAAGVCDVAETCSGTSGACPPDGFLPNGATCAGTACTGSGTCQGGVCSAATPVSCGPCETCDPAGGCIAAPRLACRRPMASGKAQIKVKDSLGGPSRDRVDWTWGNGEATTLSDFGNPVSNDGLTLCIFDRSRQPSALLFKATVPPGGTCGTRPCWKNTGKLFKFVNGSGTPDGVAKMSLIPGVAGKAKILFKARGIELSQRPFGVPMPPLPVPVTVQLQSDNGQCWEANYSRSGLRSNTGDTFAATSD